MPVVRWSKTFIISLLVLFCVGCRGSSIVITSTPSPLPRVTSFLVTPSPTPLETSATITNIPDPINARLQDINLDVVGQIGGTAQAIILQDSYAFVGVGPRLVTLDISESGPPQIAARSEVLPGVIHALAAGDNSLVYVGNGSNLAVLEINGSRMEPRVIYQIEIPGFMIRDMVLENDHLYISTMACNGEECTEGYLIIATLNEKGFPEINRNVDFPGVPAGIIISGSRAFIATNNNNIYFIDISLPQEAQIITSFNIGRPINSLMMVGEDIFVGLDREILLLNVSDPVNPQEIGGFNVAGGAVESMAYQSGKVYFVSGYCDVGVCFQSLGEVAVNNSSDETGAILSSSRIAITNGVVYWVGQLGVRLADIGTNENSVYLPIQSFYSFKILATGDGVLMVDGERHLYAIDVNNLDFPFITSAFPVEQHCDDCRFALLGLEASRNLAFLNAWEDGIRIIDVTNPANFHELGSLDVHGDNRNGVLLENDMYITAESDNLEIWNVSDPANPQHISKFPLGGDISGLAVEGHFAYVLTEYSGLYVINIVNPRSPKGVGHIDLGDNPTSIKVFNSQAFVTFAHCRYLCVGELWVISVDNPIEPQYISKIDLNEGVFDVVIQDDFAYLATQKCGAGSCGGGINVIDIADATQWQKVFQIDLPGRVTDIVIQDDHLYVAGTHAGFLILQQSVGR